MQFRNYGIVRLCEHLLDLVNFEGRPRRVVAAILQVEDVDVVVAVSLLRGQREECLSIHASRRGLEVVSKELEEFGQILGERTTVIDSKLLEESRGHEDNTVGVETARVGLVQVVLGEHFLNYEDNVPQVDILLLQFFNLVD